MICPTCHERELAPDYKSFRALRCDWCAARWAWERWGVSGSP